MSSSKATGRRFSLAPGESASHEEGGLFVSVLTTDAMAVATSDGSWLRAMLDFEVALAKAEARAGVIPPEAAEAIERCCRADHGFDPVALGRAGRLSGNPAVALVGALRERLPGQSAQWVHFGATSQDTVDTALMLVLRQALSLIVEDLERAKEAAAGLAERYRSAPMAARTLLQQALPTTFGRKAAGWLVALTEVTEGLDHVLHHRLAVQLGGPAGTLASLGEQALGVVDEVAAELGLRAPVLPWHTDRTRVVEASSALALCAGAAAKVALDVSLLMQTEVGEAFEPSAPGRGGSSSMPHKRNPAMSASVAAAWRRAQGQSAVVLGAMAQEHERAVGAWQAEAETLSELCRSVGGAVSVTADIVAGLEVDTARMARNLEPTMDVVGNALPDLSSYLGPPEAFVDRALALYRAARSA
jgi:3-carboxy-cis,cis-muconate cycloisomerase